MLRLTIIALALFPLLILRPANAKEFRVVIDPGHGGADFGTVFRDRMTHIAEKDVTLILAREAARQLRQVGIRTILTRDSDRDVPLASRTAIANKLKADVFLSLHMNSTATPMATDAQGIETYILNNTTDESSRRLAHFENTVVSGSQDQGEQLDVALILKDLRLDANLSESKRLACSIHKSLVSSTSRPGRGIRQALFYVLLGADMPSALVEAGFLANPKDRGFVLTLAGQRSIGGAITRAINEFRRTKGTAKASLELSRCKVN